MASRFPSNFKLHFLTSFLHIIWKKYLLKNQNKWFFLCDLPYNSSSKRPFQTDFSSRLQWRGKGVVWFCQYENCFPQSRNSTPFTYLWLMHMTKNQRPTVSSMMLISYLYLGYNPPSFVRDLAYSFLRHELSRLIPEHNFCLTKKKFTLKRACNADPLIYISRKYLPVNKSIRVHSLKVIFSTFFMKDDKWFN